PDGAMADPSDLADLLGKNHTKGYLPGVSFQGFRIDLQSTVLDEAYLPGANFVGIRNGTWSGRYADFTGADFRGAFLGGTDLTGAVFTGANLESAIFAEATVTNAVFSDAVITNAKMA